VILVVILVVIGCDSGCDWLRLVAIRVVIGCDSGCDWLRLVAIGCDSGCDWLRLVAIRVAIGCDWLRLVAIRVPTWFRLGSDFFRLPSDDKVLSNGLVWARVSRGKKPRNSHQCSSESSTSHKCWSQDRAYYLFFESF